MRPTDPLHHPLPEIETPNTINIPPDRHRPNSTTLVVKVPGHPILPPILYRTTFQDGRLPRRQSTAQEKAQKLHTDPSRIRTPIRVQTEVTEMEWYQMSRRMELLPIRGRTRSRQLTLKTDCIFCGSWHWLWVRPLWCSPLLPRPSSSTCFCWRLPASLPATWVWCCSSPVLSTPYQTPLWEYSWTKHNRRVS